MGKAVAHMIFEAACQQYGPILNAEAHRVVRSFNRPYVDWRDLMQTGFQWLGENLDYVGQWETERGLLATRKLVKASAGRRMAEVMRAEIQESHLTLTLPDDDEYDATEHGSRVEGERGRSPEFREDPAEYFYRCLAAGVASLKPSDLELLRDVFVEGKPYSVVGKERGMHLTSVGKHLHKILSQVVAEARKEAGL